MRLSAHVGPILALGLACALPPSALAPSQPRARKKAPPPALARRLEGITFAAAPGEVYVPLRELKKRVGLAIQGQPNSRELSFLGRDLPRAATRRLLDDSIVVSIQGLKEAGADVTYDRGWQVPVLAHKGKRWWVGSGVKRVVVNRARQRLRAWQGGRLLGESRVSTGSRGFRTPLGSFTAGPFKAAMHFSRQYNNAPMPWCVQVHGNICIHGSASVPSYPASHGCIRMPLTGNNPARWVYEWVDVGVPVVIAEAWTPEPPADR